jgi:hypothetical protein
MNTLDEEFETIKKFGKNYKKYLRKGKNIKFGSKEHLNKLRLAFIKNRPENLDQAKKSRSTVPDKGVYEYLKSKNNVNESDIEKIKEHHIQVMDAENKLGYYLEEFIYSKIKKNGWIWCTGNILRSIDFIKEDRSKKTMWNMLQIKMSDNSENSSSSKVRKGTQIRHWFRRFSQREEYNWNTLAEITGVEDLTEENFLEFLRNKAKN